MRRTIDSDEGPETSGGYCQAMEVRGATRTLYISGQIPCERDGSVPEAFDAQARLAWKNVGAQLTAADMTYGDIVKHTTFLADRSHRAANGRIRQEVLGDTVAALTVVITGIYDERWLLEIEAIAVA